jgi:hypothetical protein
MNLKFWSEIPKGKDGPWRPRRRWEDDIKMGLKEKRIENAY